MSFIISGKLYPNIFLSIFETPIRQLRINSLQTTTHKTPFDSSTTIDYKMVQMTGIQISLARKKSDTLVASTGRSD